MTIKPKAAAETGTVGTVTAEPVTKTFDKTVESLKQSAATATASLEQAQAQMKEGYTRVMKSAEQFVQFGQGNVDAMVKSTQILAAGLQDLTKHVAATAQANMDETVSTFRALTGVKSLKEAVELQTSFARTSFEKAVAESGKLTETSLKLMEQAAAPLTARVNAAVEVFQAR